jgi:hypothetical protein
MQFEDLDCIGVVRIVGSMMQQNLREGIAVEFIGGSMVGCSCDPKGEDPSVTSPESECSRRCPSGVKTLFP